MKSAIVRKRTLFTVLAAVAFSALCQAQSKVVGDWQGTLNGVGSQLHLVLHVASAPDEPNRNVRQRRSGRQRHPRLFRDPKGFEVDINLGRPAKPV